MGNEFLVLIVEDERTIRNFISASLATQSYAYKEAKTGQEGLAMVMSYNPDLIILDLGLPDIDGIDFIKKVKSLIDTPIIVVSARGHERDKVEALDNGADDYITKPFSIAELLARVRVVFRNKSKISNNENLNIENYEFEGLKVDIINRKVSVNNEIIHLTPIEYKILILMIQNCGKVLTHNFIIKKIWGGIIGNETQSLRVFVANLRRKIEKNSSTPTYIITEVGVGYRFVGN